MNQRRLLVLALGAGLSGHVALSRAQPSNGSLRRVGVRAPSTRAGITIPRSFLLRADRIIE